jgi:hypothetical protein
MAKIFNPNCIKICFDSLSADKFQELNVIFFYLIQFVDLIKEKLLHFLNRPYRIYLKLLPYKILSYFLSNLIFIIVKFFLIILFVLNLFSYYLMIS